MSLFCIASADDFKSATFDSTGFGPIRVHADQFMVIRNFTQEGGSTRGVVTVTRPPGSMVPTDTVQVLTAAILTTSSATPPDIINNVVIAGPADVQATCGAPSGSNCFISFKKDSNN